MNLRCQSIIFSCGHNFNLTTNSGFDIFITSGVLCIKISITRHCKEAPFDIHIVSMPYFDVPTKLITRRCNYDGCGDFNVVTTACFDSHTTSTARCWKDVGCVCVDVIST